MGIIERLNSIETEQTLMSADLKKNTEFRILNAREVKWVIAPQIAEQFMLIEDFAGELRETCQKILKRCNAPYDQQQASNLYNSYETRIYEVGKMRLMS